MRTYDDDNFYEDSDTDKDGYYGLILVGGAGLLGIVITLVIALINFFRTHDSNRTGQEMNASY